ncbi:MAG: hypothetical protein ACR2P4_08615 [Gammaproteobacteria bacterium]
MTKNITDILRPFLVVLFVFGFGSLTACGGGGGNTAMMMSPPPPVTMTTAPPVTLGFNAPELGALFLNAADQQSPLNRRHFIILSVAAEGETRNIAGLDFALRRQNAISRSALTNSVSAINRAILHASGDIVHTTVGLTAGELAVAFQTRPGITLLTQLCPALWLTSFINTHFGANTCTAQSGLSYSPNMPNVLHAAMADTFHRGIGIGESRLAFSGRHNGNDRAAGFTYDMGSFAMRTDYAHLPSKQDGGVFLDTYRFGIVRPINDESRFFAGFDSYDNAILALDVNAENLHRFGVALGDGYAVQYELRIRL